MSTRGECVALTQFLKWVSMYEVDHSVCYTLTTMEPYSRLLHPVGGYQLGRSSFGIILLACATYYAMAVLAQLNKVAWIRLTLLPVVLWTSWSIMILEPSGDATQLQVNTAVSFVAILAMRSIVWTFVRKPLQRFPVQVKVPSDTKSRMPTGAWGSQQTNIKQALWNACDLCVNLRGIGWSWSPFCNLKEVTSQGRVNFLFKTAAHVAFYALAVDVATESVHIVAPTTIGRGTILDTSLPYPKRLFHAAAAACIFIVHLYSAMELIYNVSSFCCVSWLGQDPAQWPPMFDQPWQSTSLGEFWGRRWHQLFRDCFVSLGSRPFIMLSEKLSSVPISVDSNKAKGGRRERQASRNPLPVLGAFFISGVLHDMGCRSMGNKDPVRIIGFFMMQAVGVILERILAKRLAHSFRTADGPGLKTEHTLLARIWVALWLLLWGIPFVDAWAQAGLLGVRIFPEPLKPLRIVQVVWNMTTANLVSFLTSRLG